MALLRDDDPPPLYVPDLARPLGAAVDPAGLVSCCVCAQRVAVSSADVVGQGYRSQRAEVMGLAAGQRDDVSLHLSQHERERMRRSGVRMTIIGLAVLLPALALLVASPDLLRVTVIVGAFGLSMVVGGLHRARAAGTSRPEALPPARMR